MKEGPKWHGFKHPAIALENALKITALNRIEQDIIKKHMWPLTLCPPRYIESWVVCFADTYCGMMDCFIFLRNFVKLRIRF